MTEPTKAREVILDVLLEILEHGAYSHVVLKQALDKYQYLSKQDRALITRVTEGTLERLLTVDAVLGQCASVPVKKMKPVIRTVLRMSVYQILWMDRVPDRAVCNEAVNLACSRRFQGLKGFVNGVLRTVARRKEEFTFDSWQLRYSMPDILIELWKGQYPSTVVEEMLQAFLGDTPTTVRCNLDRAPAARIRESLVAQGVTVEESPLLAGALVLSHYDYLEGLEAFQNGWIQVQDAASGLVGEAADPRPGDVVLDVCGAPGGKSLHLADKLKGTGRVVVRDLTEQKVRLVEENLRRTGYDNIEAQVWDARIADPAWEQKADIVLADLPCSGLGVIGRKPDIKYQVTPEKLESLAMLQREILTAVAGCVKPGGKLIYSTCTVNRMENEDQRSWFLENFPFEGMSLEETLGKTLDADTLKDGYVQLLPGRDPCDGFFIAAFKRKHESGKE